MEQVERQLTAILAANVAGYSRLMAADEQGTLAALNGKVISRLEVDSRWALARSARALVAERDALKEKLAKF
jgi:adenylate cyclase